MYQICVDTVQNSVQANYDRRMGRWTEGQKKRLIGAWAPLCSKKNNGSANSNGGPFNNFLYITCYFAYLENLLMLYLNASSFMIGLFIIIFSSFWRMENLSLVPVISNLLSFPTNSFRAFFSNIHNFFLSDTYL